MFIAAYRWPGKHICTQCHACVHIAMWLYHIRANIFVLHYTYNHFIKCVFKVIIIIQYISCNISTPRRRNMFPVSIYGLVENCSLQMQHIVM